MFLTPEELFQLTNYKQKHKQIKKLEEEGIPFIYSRYGHPKVPSAFIENMGRATNATKRKREPNINALKQKLKLK